VRGEVTVVAPIDILEISASGMQVETADALHIDSVHTFRLTLGTERLVVKGRVVHARIADVEPDGVRYRTGVVFVELSDASAAAIGRFVAGTIRARQTAG
jgi:hypothetical protein